MMSGDYEQILRDKKLWPKYCKQALDKNKVHPWTSLRKVSIKPLDDVDVMSLYENLKMNGVRVLRHSMEESRFLNIHRLLLVADFEGEESLKQAIFNEVIDSKLTKSFIHMFCDYTFVGHLNLNARNLQQTNIKEKAHSAFIKLELGEEHHMTTQLRQAFEKMSEMDLKKLGMHVAADYSKKANVPPRLDICYISKRDGLVWLEMYCSKYPQHINMLHPVTGVAPLHIVSSTYGDYKEELAFNLKAIQLLHKFGGNVNIKDKYGATALHYAAAGGFTEGCRLLIQLGADRAVKDQNGLTAGTLALLYENFEEAAACGHYDLAAYGRNDCEICQGEKKDFEQMVAAHHHELSAIGHFAVYKQLRVVTGPKVLCLNDMPSTFMFRNVPAEGDVDKMLIHLQHSNLGFDNPLVRCDEAMQIKAAINNLLVEVMNEMSAKTKPDNDVVTFKDMVFTGSSVQGGKTGLPDEFDVNIVLDFSKSYVMVISEDVDHMGFCQLQYKEQQELLLDIHQLKTQFRYLFGREVLKLYQSGWSDPSGHLSIAYSSTTEMFPKMKEEGHIYALNLYWDSSKFKHLQIKVDIAPTIFAETVPSTKIMPGIFHKDPSLSHLVTYPLPYTEPTTGTAYCLPFFKNQSEDVQSQAQRCLVSYSLKENELFQQMSPLLKECYGTLKAMIPLVKNFLKGSVDDYTSGYISTYYLKQAMFYMHQKRKDMAASGETLLNVIKEALALIEQWLNSQVLPCYFNPKNNLLYNDKSELSESHPLIIAEKQARKLAQIRALQAVLSQQNTTSHEKILAERPTSTTQSNWSRLANFDLSSM